MKNGTNGTSNGTSAVETKIVHSTDYARYQTEQAVRAERIASDPAAVCLQVVADYLPRIITLERATAYHNVTLYHQAQEVLEKVTETRTVLQDIHDCKARLALTDTRVKEFSGLARKAGYTLSEEEKSEWDKLEASREPEKAALQELELKHTAITASLSKTGEREKNSFTGALKDTEATRDQTLLFASQREELEKVRKAFYSSANPCIATVLPSPDALLDIQRVRTSTAEYRRKFGHETLPEHVIPARLPLILCAYLKDMKKVLADKELKLSANKWEGESKEKAKDAICLLKANIARMEGPYAKEHKAVLDYVYAKQPEWVKRYKTAKRTIANNSQVVTEEVRENELGTDAIVLPKEEQGAIILPDYAALAAAAA